MGAQNQPAFLTITNTSIGAPIENQTVTVTRLRLNPSCAAAANDQCVTPEPRPIPGTPIFDIDPPGVILTDPAGPAPTGRAGSSCAGITFAVSPPDLSGTVTFTPSGPLTLGPSSGPAALARCIIDFTFDTLQRPLDGETNAFTFVDLMTANAQPVPAQGNSQIITINQAPPTIMTAVAPLGGSPTPGTPLVVTAGTVVTDTATVTGVPFGPPLTGTVTFRLFRTDPSNPPAFPDCLGASIDSLPIPVVPVGGAFLGAPPTATATFVPPAPPGVGNYVFVATYNQTGADGNYSVSTGVCGDRNEQFVVQQILPVIAVVKTANPTVVSEPGGPVVFTVRVINTGPNDITLTSLVDSVDGGAPINLNGQGTCATAAPGSRPPTPPVLTARGGEYTCTFTRQVAGQPGEESDVVTAIGTDLNGNTATADDDAVVTIIGTPPAITVFKDATPPSLPEPGGTFTFRVRVRNDSPAEAVTITSLSDDIYGDIINRPGSTCGTLIGTMLAPGAISAPCTFTGLFNGPGGATQTDIVTAVAVDDDGETDTATDDATVSITNLLPTVLIDKRAAPPTLPEPGGDFTFNVVVTNTSNEPVTITSLTDSVFGSLNTRGTCTGAIGTLLAAADPASEADTFRCSFVAPFTGNAGDSEIDIATVVVTDADGSTATDSDDAIVALTDVLPTIVVDKTASPPTRLEPGGTFTFNVVVTNTSNEPVTITALTDDIYGNIANQGTCTTAVGTVLAAANPGTTDTFTCSFDGQFSGGPGAQQRDVVTAIAVDDDGSTATDDDDAVVAITNVLPTIVVDKTASPATLPEPGGTFTFNVVVTNVSVDPVTITSLTDDIYGNIANQGTCTTAIGRVLPGSGGSFSCSFTGPFTGSAGDTQTDIVTAIAVDTSGDSATDDDDAMVGITDVPPTVLLDKTATPLTLPEPGGTFTFQVVVTNTSIEQVTIESLVDDIYGNLATQGTCVTAIGTVLAADPDGPGPVLGGRYICSFQGPFNGQAGAAQTDVVTVTVRDDDGTPATDTDDAVVTLTDVPPTVLVDKTAAPLTRPEPGGTFTFNVRVTNTSNEAVTITTLTDDIYGNIATQGTCTTAVGTVLAADPDGTGPQLGGVYTCSFDGPFTGDAGDTQTDVVTATVIDDDGTSATDTDDAVVALTDAPPTVLLDKTATPLTLPAPGGTFTFQAVVTNTSAEPVTITALSDNIYGNIATQGTCTTAIGTVLAADPDGAGPLLGGVYICTFPGVFNGAAGASQTDVITVTVTDNEGNPATDSDDAVVTLDQPPTVLVDKTATPLTLPLPGGTFTFQAVVTNTSNEQVTITELTDDIYGDLSTQGTCTTAIGTVLAADPDGAGPLLGGQFTCTFPGVFNGAAGASQTDVVTVIVEDDDGNPATDSDDATVTIEVPPTVLVDKTATPLTLPEPGGTFTFQAVVTNTSAEQVTITELTDDIYGDLSTQGTCTTAIGTILSPDPDGPGPLLGERYTCTFPGVFTGAVGDEQTDVVTVIVEDDDGNPATDTDDATVTIDDEPPTVLLDKTATPLTLPDPGGTFTFTVKVTNTSDEEVTITELTDDVYGDISTKGTCTDAVGTVLEPDPDGTGPETGGTYTCSFPGLFNGTSGASQTDIITVTVEDDDGTPASDTDDAVVKITPKPPAVIPEEKGKPPAKPPVVASRGPLPRTGAEATRLVTMAGALILIGTLLVGSSTRAFVGLSRSGRSRRRKR